MVEDDPLGGMAGLHFTSQGELHGLLWCKYRVGCQLLYFKVLFFSVNSGEMVLAHDSHILEK